MTYLEFLLFVVIVVGAAWVVLWVLHYLLRDYPPIIDRLIWVAAILLIVVRLLQVTGLIAQDPEIPTLKE